MKDGKPLHLVFITMTGSAALDTEMLEAQSMLAAVGIDSELKSFSPSLYYAPGDGPWARGDFDLAIDANNSGPDPDDSDIFSCASREPNGFNAARYCTPEMDALQRASLQQPDPVKRRPLVARIEELAVSDVPYVFIANPPIEFAKVRSLRNATPSAQYDFYRVEDWSFST